MLYTMIFTVRKTSSRHLCYINDITSFHILQMYSYLQIYDILYFRVLIVTNEL